jgi:hypothetical protein
MPIFLRNYYVKRINQMIDQENEQREQRLAKQATKQTSSDRNLRR